uniref:Cellular communication network factor 5 n=1 Tax=Myripristis murdjan TaxID=586833 RepID=A0A667XVR4_9TELE
RQEGEACSARLPCDSQRGLRCDYSASFPGGPGECVGQNDLGCDLNGMRLEEGQTFQPSCAQLCHCVGGGVTCVPLCTDDLQVPSCPSPQLVRLPGRCCKEWICDGLDNREWRAERTRQDGQPAGPVSNCIERTTDWSPCSRSCGPGVSTRSSNKNWACRLQTQTRLCQVRPCQLPLRYVLPHFPRQRQDSSYTHPLPIRLEHHGCWSTRAYRPRFCVTACPEGRCCSPARTRTVTVAFRCPEGRLTQQQVMMIESCSCSSSSCPRPPAAAAWRALPWL